MQGHSFLLPLALSLTEWEVNCFHWAGFHLMPSTKYWRVLSETPLVNLLLHLPWRYCRENYIPTFFCALLIKLYPGKFTHWSASKNFASWELMLCPSEQCRLCDCPFIFLLDLAAVSWSPLEVPLQQLSRARWPIHFPFLTWMLLSNLYLLWLSYFYISIL